MTRTSICLSTSFASLLRRLLNVFSVFSISQHYVLIGKVASNVPVDAGESQETHHRDSAGSEGPPSPSRSSFPDREIQQQENDPKQKELHKHNLQLFDSARAPRCPIVLCHGLYGYDVRGPESFPKLRVHYWSDVLNVLKKVGAEVVVTGVPGTASISSRAERMDQYLKEKMKGRDINFIAHSMGGLDCRHLITHIRPTEYRILSLTSLSVPHRGSPFMDWCMANIGIGSPRPFPFPSPLPPSSLNTGIPDGSSSGHKPKRPVPYSLSSPLLTRPPPSASPSNDTQSTTAASSSIPPSASSADSASASASKLSALFNLSVLQSLPSNVTSLILSLIDSPAYSNLTTGFLRDSFNPYTPDDPNVKYFSVAARVQKMSVWHPLWIPKMVVDAAEELESREEQEHELSVLASRQGLDMMLPYPTSAGTGTLKYRTPRGNSAEVYGMTAFKGNDGLVPISSAKWGTFLGVVEGCDHWDIRGTGGFGSVPAGDGDSPGGTGREGETRSSGGLRLGLDFDWEESWRGWKDWVSAVSGTGSGETKPGGNNAADKQKTQIQARASLSAVPRSQSDSLALPATGHNEKKLLPKHILHDPASSSWTALNGFSEGQRFDLEKFYVALCRKLYDEGL